MLDIQKLELVKRFQAATRGRDPVFTEQDFDNVSLSVGEDINKTAERLAKQKGIYVPSFYDVEVCEKTGLQYVTGVKPEFEGVIPNRVERYFVDSLKDYPFPTKSPIPHMTAIFDRFSVELSRGCTEGCRFCQAGMIYRPVRERKPDDVKKLVIEGLKNLGAEFYGWPEPWETTNTIRLVTRWDTEEREINQIIKETSTLLRELRT